TRPTNPTLLAHLFAVLLLLVLWELRRVLRWELRRVLHPMPSVVWVLVWESSPLALAYMQVDRTEESNILRQIYLR
ncbi:MAG: hypothetical protein VZR95_10360, partial [Alphaproteobacteria bacterium]